MRQSTGELRLPALEIKQGPNRTIYSFAVDGKLVPSFANVSRLHRNDREALSGYQRPEVLSHISEIKTYLESQDPMIPNALVIAFDKQVRFETSGIRKEPGSPARHGTLIIPLRRSGIDADKPGWVVDGQQRLAAIREAQIDSFPICVTAFIASEEAEQREQFILVNSTKPLPKSLIYELLPETAAALPSLLQRRRFPAVLLSLMNTDPKSPLFRMVETPTNAQGVIKDNSILKMIENSLSDGALYRFKNTRTGDGDADSMIRILNAFWGAVAEVFKDAWGLPPRRSRLMHGAGIVSLGFIMDAISDRHRHSGSITRTMFSEDLEPLREVCRWTNGYWEFGPGKQRKWNEIQNTSNDIQLLANYLLMQYKALVWNRHIGRVTGASSRSA